MQQPLLSRPDYAAMLETLLLEGLLPPLEIVFSEVVAMIRETPRQMPATINLFGFASTQTITPFHETGVCDEPNPVSTATGLFGFPLPQN